MIILHQSPHLAIKWLIPGCVYRTSVTTSGTSEECSYFQQVGSICCCNWYQRKRLIDLLRCYDGERHRELTRSADAKGCSDDERHRELTRSADAKGCSDDERHRELTRSADAKGCSDDERHRELTRSADAKGCSDDERHRELTRSADVKGCSDDERHRELTRSADAKGCSDDECHRQQRELAHLWKTLSTYLCYLSFVALLVTYNFKLNMLFSQILCVHVN